MTGPSFSQKRVLFRPNKDGPTLFRPSPTSSGWQRTTKTGHALSPGTALESQGLVTWRPRKSNYGESSCSEDGDRTSSFIISKTLRWIPLAVESSAKLSIQEAKLQLQDLLRRTTEVVTHPIASSPVEMLADCEAGMDADTAVQATDDLVLNLNAGGKLHRPAAHNSDDHPRIWRTRCGWRFGNTHTDFRWVKSDHNVPVSATKCSKCFPWTKVHYPFQQLIFFFFIHLCGFRRWEGVELDEVCQVAPLAALDVDGAESPWP